MFTVLLFLQIRCVEIVLCVFSFDIFLIQSFIIEMLMSVVARLCCISPVLAAKVLPGVEVTVGHEEEEGGKWPYAGTAQAIKALGAKHCVKDVTISCLEIYVS